MIIATEISEELRFVIDSYTGLLGPEYFTRADLVLERYLNQRLDQILATTDYKRGVDEIVSDLYQLRCNLSPTFLYNSTWDYVIRTRLPLEEAEKITDYFLNVLANNHPILGANKDVYEGRFIPEIYSSTVLSAIYESKSTEYMLPKDEWFLKPLQLLLSAGEETIKNQLPASAPYFLRLHQPLYKYIPTPRDLEELGAWLWTTDALAMRHEGDMPDSEDLIDYVFSNVEVFKRFMTTVHITKVPFKFFPTIISSFFTDEIENSRVMK